MPPIPPRTVRQEPACFIVADAEQRPVAYVYYDEEPLPGTKAKWSAEEAREIAEEIARPLLGLDEASLGALRKVRSAASAIAPSWGRALARCPAMRARATTYSPPDPVRLASAARVFAAPAGPAAPERKSPRPRPQPGAPRSTAMPRRAVSHRRHCGPLMCA